MKFIISGGGTGGHIYPAIAIAEALKNQLPTCEILFVGAEEKMEMEKVPKAGFNIVGLPIRGLQRKVLSFDNLKFPFRVLKSLWKARQIVKEFKPDVAIGVGGYASWALLQVAIWQNIKTVIQEQNSYAGLTNKLLSKNVTKICVAYPNMENYFPKEKIAFCGNPVRQDILNLENIKEEAYEYFNLKNDKKTILVIGGSLGARSINESIKNGIKTLLNLDYQILWQTGGTNYEAIKKFENELKSADTARNQDDSLKEIAQTARTNVVVKDFIYKMDYAYAIADLVVSRAGALAISELAIAQKPCLLVPFPFAAEDHQSKNAAALANAGAAMVIKDSQVQQDLIQNIVALAQNEQKQNEMKQAIKQFAKPKAAKEIVKLIIEI